MFIVSCRVKREVPCICSYFEGRKYTKHDSKGKHPLVGWCEEEDHLLASGGGIMESDAQGGGFWRLMAASDLPTRTARLAGVFLLLHLLLWRRSEIFRRTHLWEVDYHKIIIIPYSLYYHRPACKTSRWQNAYMYQDQYSCKFATN